MVRLQFSLTDQEAKILANYGLRLGYNLPKTVRYILSKTSEKLLTSNFVDEELFIELGDKGLNILDDF